MLKDGSIDYIYGPGSLPLEQINGSTTYWFHHDQIGSTRLVTDSTGTAQATYTYDPYGGLTSSTGSITNPFRFCGQYQDSESGFYYLRARYYDPSTAQLASLDPAIQRTRQPYEYAAGNPLNLTDNGGVACGAISLGGIGFGGYTLAGWGSIVGYGWVQLGACTNGDVYVSATGGYDVNAPGWFHKCYPSCNPHPYVSGLFAGGGLGLYGSTAQTAQDNGGVFHCSAIAVGGGEAGGVISTGQGSSPHGPVNTAETGFLGPGLGVGGANYDTNTGVISGNPIQWVKKIFGW